MTLKHLGTSILQEVDDSSMQPGTWHRLPGRTLFFISLPQPFMCLQHVYSFNKSFPPIFLFLQTFHPQIFLSSHINLFTLFLFLQIFLPSIFHFLEHKFFPCTILVDPGKARGCFTNSVVKWLQIVLLIRKETICHRLGTLKILLHYWFTSLGNFAEYVSFALWWSCIRFCWLVFTPTVPFLPQFSTIPLNYPQFSFTHKSLPPTFSYSCLPPTFLFL